MMDAMTFPAIRSSSRGDGGSDVYQMQQRLHSMESELASKDSMNNMLQAKLSGILRKCDSKEQKLHNSNIAMRKMENEMSEKMAKLKLQTEKVMAGEKYERMQDDLRRRAATIMDQEKKLANVEDK